MSEKLTDGDLEWARKVAEHMPTDSRTLLADPAHWTALLANTVAEYRAAAEERGRRAGIEQCRDFVRSWAPTRPNTTVLIGYAFEQLGTLLGLAPRDSGKDQT